MFWEFSLCRKSGLPNLGEIMHVDVATPIGEFPANFALITSSLTSDSECRFAVPGLFNPKLWQAASVRSGGFCGEVSHSYLFCIISMLPSPPWGGRGRGREPLHGERGAQSHFELHVNKPPLVCRSGRIINVFTSTISIHGVFVYTMKSYKGDRLHSVLTPRTNCLCINYP